MIPYSPSRHAVPPHHSVVFQKDRQPFRHLPDHLSVLMFPHDKSHLYYHYKRFLDFCIGKKSLPLTYDPFFKYLFDPEIHGDRLSRFVSSLLGFEVKILRVLPGEDRMIDGESCLIMDLLAETADGALCNVEIQKQGYAFPAERISCYSADLVMRQYMRVRGQAEAFSYRDIKKVYVIVLFEKSTAVFHQHPASYLHYGKTCFDTGLEMELLQEFFLIALDVFREIPYTEDTLN